MTDRSFIAIPSLSWLANAGHPGDATRVSKKNPGGPVKPGHDNLFCVVR